MLMAVAVLLATLGADAEPSPDTAPLKEARQIEEINAAGDGLMRRLGAQPTKCPSGVVDSAFRLVSVLFCGTIADGRPIDDLTATIDDYMLATAHARVTDTPWTKKRKFMVREYSIDGFAVTVHASVKRPVVVLTYHKQCFATTLPPPRTTGEIVTNPVLDQKEAPKYPSDALQRGVEGELVFQLLLRADGTIGDICLVYSSRPGFGFEESAVNAIREWRYEPARLDGTPVAVPFTVSVSFRTR